MGRPLWHLCLDATQRKGAESKEQTLYPGPRGHEEALK